MNLFQKAQAGLSLTPGQRAILKLIQSLFIGALVAALVAIAEYLATPEINWATLSIVAITAAALSIAHGIAKFVTAQGDVYQPLGNALEQIIEEIERRYHLSPIATQPQPAPLQGVAAPAVQGPLVVVHSPSSAMQTPGGAETSNTPVSISGYPNIPTPAQAAPGGLPTSESAPLQGGGDAEDTAPHRAV